MHISDKTDKFHLIQKRIHTYITNLVFSCLQYHLKFHQLLLQRTLISSSHLQVLICLLVDRMKRNALTVHPEQITMSFCVTIAIFYFLLTVYLDPFDPLNISHHLWVSFIPLTLQIQILLGFVEIKTLSAFFPNIFVRISKYLQHIFVPLHDFFSTFHQNLFVLAVISPGSHKILYLYVLPALSDCIFHLDLACQSQNRFIQPYISILQLRIHLGFYCRRNWLQTIRRKGQGYFLKDSNSCLFHTFPPRLERKSSPWYGFIPDRNFVIRGKKGNPVFLFTVDISDELQETHLITKIISFESNTKFINIRRSDLDTLKDLVFEADSPQKLKRQKRVYISILKGDDTIEADSPSPHTSIPLTIVENIKSFVVKIPIKLYLPISHLLVLYKLHLYYYYKPMHFKKHNASPPSTSPPRAKSQKPLQPPRSISPHTTLPNCHSPDQKRYSQASLKAKVSSSGQQNTNLIKYDLKAYLDHLIEQTNKKKQKLEQYIKIFNLMLNQHTQVRCLEHSNTLTIYCQTQRKALCANCVYGFTRHRTHKLVPLKDCGDKIIEDTHLFSDQITKDIKNLDECILISEGNTLKLEHQLKNKLKAEQQDYLDKIEEVKRKHAKKKQKIQEIYDALIVKSKNIEKNVEQFKIRVWELFSKIGGGKKTSLNTSDQQIGRQVICSNLSNITNFSIRQVTLRQLQKISQKVLK